MFQFFDWIINLISSIINFVVSFFKMLVQIITFIVAGFAYVGTVTAYLPTFALAPLLALVGYSVIVTLINKGK